MADARIPHSELVARLNQFRNEGKYCDVNVRIREKTFSCHRVILASMSEYFDTKFEGNFQESLPEDIVLPDHFDAITFGSILDFIYGNSPPAINLENVSSIYLIGQYLGVSTVVDVCAHFLLSHLNMGHIPVSTILEVFNLTKDGNLRNKLIRYILQFPIYFLAHVEFLKTPYHNFCALLEQNRSMSNRYKNENFLLDAVIRWVYHSRQIRKQHFTELVEMINLEKLSAEYRKFIREEYRLSHCADDQFSYIKMEGSILTDDECGSTNSKSELHPFSDPRLNAPTIHILAKDPNEVYLPVDVCVRTYHIFSLNNHKDQPEWFLSRKFTQKQPLNLVTYAASDNSIYCFSGSKPSFRAFSSVDLSLDPSHILMDFPLDCSNTCRPRMCVWDDYSIYLYGRPSNFPVIQASFFNLEEFNRGFYRYASLVNKWLPVAKMKKNLRNSCLITNSSLIYLIAGEDRRGRSERYVQAYDPRSPAWISLPKCKHYNYSHTSSGCSVNERIYVTNGQHIETFDHRATKWETIKNGRGTAMQLAAFEDKIYVFDTDARTIFLYDPMLREWSHTFGNTSHNCSSFDNVIIFKPLQF